MNDERARLRNKLDELKIKRAELNRQIATVEADLEKAEMDLTLKTLTAYNLSGNLVIKRKPNV